MTSPDQRGRDTRKVSAWKGEVDFQALADSLPALAFVHDATGACLFANTRVQEFTGLGTDGVLGDGWTRAIHPKDRLGTLRAWAEALASTEPYEVEHRLRAADGHHAWFLLRATSVREKGRVVRWIGHATDIDDAKRAGATFAAEADGSRNRQARVEEFAARLLDATADRVKTLTLDGRLLSMNAAGLCAMQVEELAPLLGRPWSELWRPTGFHIAAQVAVGAAAQGGIGRFTGHCRTGKGELRWWNVAITPIRDADGAPERLLCVSRDVPEPREAGDRIRHVHDLSDPLFGADGGQAKVLGAVGEAAGFKAVHTGAATAKEARYRSLFEQATLGIALLAPDGRFLEVNARFCDIVGRASGEILAGDIRRITHPDDLEAWMPAVQALADGHIQSCSLENRFVTPAAGAVWAQLTGAVVRGGEGRPDHLVAVLQPLPGPAQGRAELLSLRASESQAAFRLALTDALRDLDDPVAMMATAAEFLGRYLGVAQVGFAEVEEAGERIAVHRDWNDGRIPPVAGSWRMDDLGPRIIRDMQADVTLDPRTSAPDVLAAYAAIRTRAILDLALIRDGRMVAMIFLHQPEPRPWSPVDVALAREGAERLWSAVEHARALRRLRESEAQARGQLVEIASIYAAAPIGPAVLDRDLCFLRINDRLAEINGVPARLHIGRTVQEIVPDLSEQAQAAMRDVLAGKELCGQELLRGSAPAQPQVARTWRENWLPLRDDGGAITGIVVSAEEIIATEAAEAVLRDGEARFRAITDAMSQMVWSTRAAGHHDFFNARWHEYTGTPSGSTDGEGWLGLFHPEDQDRIRERWQHSLDTGESYEIEYRLRHHGGEYRWVLSRALPVRDEASAILRWIGTCTDIHEIVETRRALAEGRVAIEEARAQLEARVAERTEALKAAARSLQAETARREEAQSQFLQAQKIEVLGQLVGGVAHDFNNILAAVQGAFSVLQRRVEDPKLRFVIEQGQKAGDRACALVRQMLAFARRETLRPKVLNPAAMLSDLGAMLRQIVGPRVESHVEAAPGTWLILADPHQFEMALLNLAINARDAMPEGGSLRIEVRNLDATEPRPPSLGPGDHVVIADAAQALAQHHPIDLLLTDVVMPGIDGPTLARALRSGRPGLPVLYMTGYAGPAGLDGEAVLAKPFARNELSLRVLTALGRIDAGSARRLAAARRAPERLLVRLTTPALRLTYDRWTTALGPRRLPVLADFDVAGLPTDAMMLLRPEAGDSGTVFRVQGVGPSLVRLLGRSLEGEAVAPEHEDRLGSMTTAYGRCEFTLAPAFDWARLRLDDGCANLERLVLPFSEDGAHISHLLGLILYEEAGRPGRASDH